MSGLFLHPLCLLRVGSSWTAVVHLLLRTFAFPLYCHPLCCCGLHTFQAGNTMDEAAQKAKHAAGIHN